MNENKYTRATESGIRKAKEYLKDPYNEMLRENPFTKGTQFWREWIAGFLIGSRQEEEEGDAE